MEHELYHRVDPTLRQKGQDLAAITHSSKKDPVKEIWEGYQQFTTYNEYLLSTI